MCIRDRAVVLDGDLGTQAHALYASERYDLRRRVNNAVDIEVEIGNASVLRIPVRNGVYGTVSTETRTVATPAGDVVETVITGWLDLRGGNGLYLLSGWADGPVTVHAIESRGATGASTAYHELWASVIYPRHAMIGSERLAATLTIFADELESGLPGVGEVSLALLGRAWRLVERTVDLDTDAVSLRLERPARVLPEVLLPPKVLPEVSAFFYTDLLTGGSGDATYFAVVALVPRGTFPGLTEEQVSLDEGATWQADAGEITSPSTRVDYRARTLYSDGTQSAWVTGYAVGGPS